MILKLNREEYAELEKYALYPFGQSNFYSFMAEIWGRTDPDTWQVDLDDEHFRWISEFTRRGHGEELEKVFTRPLAEASDEFSD